MFGTPLAVLSPDTPGARAYAALADELAAVPALARMSFLPTPTIADLDDPLTPRREPQASTPARQPRRRAANPGPASPPPDNPASPRPSADHAPSLADEPLVAVFAHISERLTNELADRVRALSAGRSRRNRVTQQDVLGTLVKEYLADEAAGRARRGLPPGARR